MSWIDDIENKILKITTGDGEIYMPKWKEAAKSREYNISIFDFINIEGSLVRRLKPKALTLTLILYFDGADCIDRANNFEISARDNRKWTIEHPFYGQIYVHPISLTIDNTYLNVSKITVPVIETLIETYPQGNTYAPDAIKLKLLNNFSVSSEYFGAIQAKDPIPLTALQSFLNDYNNIMGDAFSAVQDVSKYENYYRVAIKTLDSLAATPLLIIRSIQSLINFTATARQTALARFNVYDEALTQLAETVTGIVIGATHNYTKNVFEITGSTIVSAMMYSSGLGTYNNLGDVLEMQAMLSASYLNYIKIVERNFTIDAGAKTSYVPSYDIAQSLDDLYNYTIVSLFILGLNSNKKRSIILEKDSNLILLTHRFYGLDNADANIKQFMNDNNICINEVYNIKKGREIIYYVST